MQSVQSGRHVGERTADIPFHGDFGGQGVGLLGVGVIIILLLVGVLARVSDCNQKLKVGCQENVSLVEIDNPELCE